MVKKLSKEEISDINFIRTFDFSFIEEWSIKDCFLVMVIKEEATRYRVALFLSDFVARWFMNVWSVKIARNCPAPRVRSNYNYGFSVVPHDDISDSSVFSYEDNLIHEMSDSDLR